MIALRTNIYTNVRLSQSSLSSARMLYLLGFMALSVGIVGLPNVGKSTLFSALSSKQAEAANYAFCTIDPNLGVVTVPDERFDKLSELFKPGKTVPATVEFVDIAGLVKGASKGEGKGNAFLSHIRECDAIAHVVRCFEDDEIIHVEGRVNPAEDASIIETELILKDLEACQRRIDRAQKLAKGGNATEKLAVQVCGQLIAALDAGKLARTVAFENEEAQSIVRELFLLTTKPLFYVGNVKESQIGKLEGDKNAEALRVYAKNQNADVVFICASAEAEIMQLEAADRPEFLASLGLNEPGLNEVIKAGYKMLNLITFFTAGETEVHAWTIARGTKAPQAAGKIHSDFERGFIRAEVIKWHDLYTLKTEAACRSAGKMSTEGKEYVVQDGDVMHFRFNV